MILKPQQKFLLAAPGIVLPFLCWIFYTLGGGRAPADNATAVHMGLNPQLPGTWVKTNQPLLDKVKAYQKADLDSARKAASVLRDPYVGVIKKDSVRADPKANELLRQLGQLQGALKASASVSAPSAPVRQVPVLPMRRQMVDTPERDPQLDRLNSMLDKVIRIQHPGESKVAAARVGEENAEEVLPADSSSNAIAAVIPTDQTLTSGGTIAVRLAEDIRIHGLVTSRGQWVYGVVSINGDRMLVHIRSLRSERSLYNTDLQVYDLDGLPGIHIPGMMSREVAKESADEGVNGLNVMGYDPSLGAQAAEAGIQTAKTLFGRKVRLVRVSVRAGYSVLLRGSRPTANSHVAVASQKDSCSVFFNGQIQPPGFVPGGSFLQRCRMEGMELALQGIYLQDSLLWLALRWDNRSPIGYQPDYYRWVVRDKRSFKRTAEQDLPLEPVYAPNPTTVAGDSSLQQWVGFRPFALAKDKELVLELGEKNGGRTLTLVIGNRQILHAKILKP